MWPPEPRPRPAPRLGRSRLRAHDPLHGHRDGHASQPRHSYLLHPFVPARQVPESGGRRHHAQAAPHPERSDPGPGPLAAEPRALGWRGLTFNTVAAAAGPVPRMGIANKRLAVGNKDYLCQLIGLKSKPIWMQSPWRAGRTRRRSSGPQSLSSAIAPVLAKCWDYGASHSGRSIRQNCLTPLDLNVTKAARVLGMARHTLSRFLNGHTGISPDRDSAGKGGLVPCRVLVAPTGNPGSHAGRQERRSDQG